MPDSTRLHPPAGPSAGPSATPSRLVGALLLTLASAATVAFVAVPRRVADAVAGGTLDEGTLVTTARRGFVRYWASGVPDLSPELAGGVDYWFRYHVAKALFAALLLALATALGVRLWRAFVERGGRGRATAAGLVSLLGAVSLVAVMANVQGAVAPFASLLPMLVAGAPDGDFTHALGQAQTRLTESVAAGEHAVPGALAGMVDDFRRYHVAMVVVCAVVVVVLVAATLLAWDVYARTGRPDRRRRHTAALLGSAGTVASVLAIVLAIANATTAADPAPALLAFLTGGW